jgi:hypothetical protein
MILAFFRISHNCFCIGKIMDQVYGSPNHEWLSVHSGLVTMGAAWPLRGSGYRCDSSERERDRGDRRVLINDAT